MCSKEDNDVEFVGSQIRKLKDGACQSLLLGPTGSNLKEKLRGVSWPDNYRDVLASTFH